MFNIFNNHRKKRKNNNTDNSILKIFFYERESSEEIAGKGKQGYPKECTDNIIKKECIIAHFPHSRYKWCKGAYDRNKTGKNDCFPSMFFIEFPGLLKVGFIEKS